MGAQLRRDPSADGNAEAADAIERRITEAVDDLADRLRARQSELQAALEARVEALRLERRGHLVRPVDGGLNPRRFTIERGLKLPRALQALRKGWAKVEESQ